MVWLGAEQVPAARQHRGLSRCGRRVVICAGVVLTGWLLMAAGSEAATADAGGSVTTRPLIESTGGLIDLALAPNGQRLYGLSSDGARVVAIDCGRDAAGSPRVVVVGESPDGPGRQIGCIDTSVVAILRDTAGAVITTHRIPPSPDTASAEAPLQRVVIDSDAAVVTPDGMARLMVSPTRNWLAVTAVADNTPTLLRAAVAGVRVSSFSTRNSPELRADEQILAATAGASDDLVLVTAPHASPTAAASDDTSATLSMFATPGGWELLELTTGLRAIRDICSSGSSSTLWVITGADQGGTPPHPAGLWRLDAVIRDHRQAIQAVLVAPLQAPLALAAGSDDVLYVAVDDGNRILEVRPSPSGDRND